MMEEKRDSVRKTGEEGKNRGLAPTARSLPLARTLLLKGRAQQAPPQPPRIGRGPPPPPQPMESSESAMEESYEKPDFLSINPDYALPPEVPLLMAGGVKEPEEEEDLICFGFFGDEAPMDMSKKEQSPTKDVTRKRLGTETFPSSIFSDDTSSKSYIREHQAVYGDRSLTSVTDPLSDLTENQLVVLYTLYLCRDNNGFIYLNDDDVSMGDIDVWKTVKDLEVRRLVGRVRRYVEPVCVFLNYELREIMQSYTENCLVTDIDKDFFIDVASNNCLWYWYTMNSPFLNPDVSMNPRNSSRSMTLMRLAMNGRIDTLEQIICTIIKLVPKRIRSESEEFVQFWKSHCKQRIIHPTDWADGVCDKEMGRYFSVYTILSGYEKEFWELVLNKKKWSILILILMSKKYGRLYEEKFFEENVEQIQQTFLTPNGSDDGTSHITLLIQELKNKDNLLATNRQTEILEFKSENIRHQVMGYFVLNCLESDDDYKNYFKLSSFDSVSDYVRTIDYGDNEVGEEGRCLYLPSEMEETFVRESGIDIVKHITVVKDRIRNLASHILNIPHEILDWEYEARCRYVEYAKKGTQTIHRARAMIVGCAGAGKTTLLKRLQKRSLEELKQVQSTVGLEVHEDIFEILEENNVLRAVTEETLKEGKQLLSVMDFGGQCAYYACHQVYLTRRAFYLLVIDMSKSFEEKVDPEVCAQEGTMFADWGYGEYLLFWLKSVHTYCDNDAPVVIVGTRLDKINQNSDTLYNKILDHIEFNNDLKTHLERKRCFVLGFHEDGRPCIDTLADLEKCISEIAKEKRWRETIPTDWALCELVFKEMKGKGSKMILVSELYAKCFGRNEEKYAQLGDVLKFYHDIGIILYFNEGNLSDTVILDIQWFIDSFKNIITDPNHVRDIAENKRDWMDFYHSGQLFDRLLTKIWRSRDPDINVWIRFQSKKNLLQYMERLGLIAVGTIAHYIPCMNKRTFGPAEETFLQCCQNKTSVLVFRFHFLPYFVFCRLTVACLTKTDAKWTVLEDEGLCLYKNVSCFAFKQHVVVLAVHHSSIQLQVCQPGRSSASDTKKIALEVRARVEKLLQEILGNFHKKIEMYSIGYQCSNKQEVYRAHDGFIEERKFLQSEKIVCPMHEMINYHLLSETDLLYYWNLDVLPEATDPDSVMEKDVNSCVPEPERKRIRFQYFEKLTHIGREALQIYFDTVFPPSDLYDLIRNEEASLRKKLYPGQFALITPGDGSIPTSSAFDVTLMCNLLRNFRPNLPFPTTGQRQKSATDDVQRIRVYRNEVEHKTPATRVMEKGDCRVKWRDLYQAILRLSEGKLEQNIMDLWYQS